MSNFCSRNSLVTFDKRFVRTFILLYYKSHETKTEFIRQNFRSGFDSANKQSLEVHQSTNSSHINDASEILVSKFWRSLKCRIIKQTEDET